MKSKSYKVMVEIRQYGESFDAEYDGILYPTLYYAQKVAQKARKDKDIYMSWVVECEKERDL
jgi:hypothetical protein